MLIIGCDYHPGFQQIACVDTDTGELSERRLAHREQAEQFYRELKRPNLSVRVGMESSGHSRWFERLLRELQFELWIGDPAPTTPAPASLFRQTPCLSLYAPVQTSCGDGCISDA
jgi:transposase